MIVFNWLKNWFETNSGNLEHNGIVFSFSELAKTANPSQFVDIDTKTKIARFTLWETGDCNFEVLDNETAEQDIFEYQIIKSEKQLSDFLTEVFSKL